MAKLEAEARQGENRVSLAETKTIKALHRPPKPPCRQLPPPVQVRTGDNFMPQDRE